jgi:hypothetical protein
MAHIKTAILVLILSMLLSIFLTYAGILTLVQNMQGNTQRVLDSFVVERSIEVYGSIKNGSDYIASIDAAYFAQNLLVDGTLVSGAECFYNVDSKGTVLWRMTIPQTQWTIRNTLDLTCTFDLLLPIDFAGRRITELRIPMRVKTSYNLKT